MVSSILIVGYRLPGKSGSFENRGLEPRGETGMRFLLDPAGVGECGNVMDPRGREVVSLVSVWADSCMV